MTTRFVQYAILSCDKCGSTYGEPAQFVHPADARIAARNDGWALIPKRHRTGNVSKADLTTWDGLNKATGYASDICHNCEICEVCKGAPPEGFTCDTCGVKGGPAAWKVGDQVTVVPVPARGVCPECSVWETEGCGADLGDQCPRRLRKDKPDGLLRTTHRDPLGPVAAQLTQRQDRQPAL